MQLEIKVKFKIKCTISQYLKVIQLLRVHLLNFDCRFNSKEGKMITIASWKPFRYMCKYHGNIRVNIWLCERHVGTYYLSLKLRWNTGKAPTRGWYSDTYCMENVLL